MLNAAGQSADISEDDVEVIRRGKPVLRDQRLREFDHPQIENLQFGLYAEFVHSVGEKPDRVRRIDARSSRKVQ
jgi:hypothetical protein